MEKIKTRGRPKLLDDDLKRVIDTLKEKHPTWSARKILDNIHEILFSRWQNNNPRLSVEDIEKQVNSRLPGVNSIQKYLREQKSPCGKGKYSPDAPWQFGYLTKKDISAEAVSSIVRVLNWQRKQPKWDPVSYLTIREATWISRLHQIKFFKNSPEELWKIATAYSILERASNGHLDTTELDGCLLAKNFQEYQRMRLEWSKNHSEEVDNYLLWHFMELVEKDGE